MVNNRTGLPILLTFICVFAINTVQGGEETKIAVEKIKVTAAKNYVAENDNAVILDVRTPSEYDMSHITGAMNVNVQDDDFASMVAALDKDKTYLVHCTRNPENGRSSRALETLQSFGFRNLYSLEGGYVAWKEAELPLTEAGN
jgi:rhodanese-related sulfurtransferase